MRTISDQILNNLKKAGVEYIFGIPGDTIDTLMESIRKDQEVEFIICRHESNAAFMASGMSRISDKLSVVVACQGPGANNLINGLADAHADRLPVLAITGQVESSRIGTGMPQESSQLKLFDDITVFNAEVRNPENLMNLLQIGMHKAISDRGVAHIAIPSDIMKSKPISYDVFKLQPDFKARLSPNVNQLNNMVQAINQSKRPLILFGEGARNSSKQIEDLASRIHAPLVHTTRSKDLIAYDNQNLIGGIGIMGSHVANKYLQETDLLIVCGCNFAWKEFYPKTKIIKIDNDSFRLHAHIEADIPVLADLQLCLESALKKITPKKDSSFVQKAKKDWVKYLDELNFQVLPKLSKNLHPAQVVSSLNSYLQDDAIIVGDSGTTTIWFNNIATLKPTQRFLWSANLATLGGALGQAMGASFEEPNRPIVLIAGDGGFQMSIADLITAKMYKRPLHCFILNNSTYGFIEFEERSHDGNIPSGTRFLNPDYAALAKSHGAQGFTVRTKNELESVLEEIKEVKDLIIIDCIIDQETFLIPPAIKASMAKNYINSEIKSWFEK